MSKTIKNTATVRKAFGKDLAEFGKGITELKFDYEFDELQKGEPIPADEQPDEDGIRSFVNQRRAAASRSKAQNEALADAGIVKPTLDDPDVQFAEMVKIYMKRGKSREVAEQLVRAAFEG